MDLPNLLCYSSYKTYFSAKGQIIYIVNNKKKKENSLLNLVNFIHITHAHFNSTKIYSWETKSLCQLTK